MYLLNTSTLKLKEFLDGKAPEYAILSHTWGDDEVSFQDMQNSYIHGVDYPPDRPISKRLGYKKIVDCCQRALADKLEWAWVDTCCIDKRSSAELSEAINTMFWWYGQSRICYTFLEDVLDANEDPSNADSAFRRSRWFTRGWTLQELLAPSHILFFDSSWSLIGQTRKASSKLVDTITEITNIPAAFLLGADLREAGIAQRMSWASRRVTTRREDMAYSLLGIFGVNMPLLYGEGDRAFIRLQGEIAKRAQDQSIFAWGTFGEEQDAFLAVEKPCGVLASSPADFSECADVLSCDPMDPLRDKSFQIVSAGIRMEVVLGRIWTGTEVAVLACYHARYPWAWIAIPISTELTKYGSGKLLAEEIRSDHIIDRCDRRLLLCSKHSGLPSPVILSRIRRTIYFSNFQEITVQKLRQDNDRNIHRLLIKPPRGFECRILPIGDEQLYITKDEYLRSSNDLLLHFSGMHLSQSPAQSVWSTVTNGPKGQQFLLKLSQTSGPEPLQCLIRMRVWIRGELGLQVSCNFAPWPREWTYGVLEAGLANLADASPGPSFWPTIELSNHKITSCSTGYAKTLPTQTKSVLILTEPREPHALKIYERPLWYFGDITSRFLNFFLPVVMVVFVLLVSYFFLHLSYHEVLAILAGVVILYCVTSCRAIRLSTASCNPYDFVDTFCAFVFHIGLLVYGWLYGVS